MTPKSETPESATPLTDAAYQAVLDGECLPGCDSYAHEEMCPYASGDRVMAEFARSLESSLQKARTLEAAAVANMERFRERGLQLEGELTQARSELSEKTIAFATVLNETIASRERAERALAELQERCAQIADRWPDDDAYPGGDIGRAIRALKPSEG